MMIADRLHTLSAYLLNTFVIKASFLLVGLFAGLLAAGGSAWAVDTPVPHVGTASGPAPAVNAAGFYCHIMPIQQVAGGPAVTITYPDCDPRSKMPPAPATTQSQPCHGGCGVMQDHGGTVITSTTHFFTFLNCAGGANSCFSDVGNPFQFVSDFFNSNFIHVLDQSMRLFVKQGSSGRYATSGSGCMWSASAPHVMHDSDLQSYILGCVNFLVGNGATGGNAQMFSMFLPQGQDLCFNGGGAGNCYCPDNDSACNGGQWSNGGGFCAYHSSFTGTVNGSSVTIIYQAMPYQNVSTANGNCQIGNGPNGAVADSTNNVLSHEISETITDPFGNAWYRTSDGQEDGDICNFMEQNPIYLRATAYSIQQEYSNLAQNCVGAVRTVALTHDFNFDMNSDLLWYNNGAVGMWLMDGNNILSSVGIASVPTVWSIVGQRDFNGDGNTDILWHDTSGDVGMWLMNGSSISASAGVANVPTNWSIVGTGDFNFDGKGDILWHDTAGDVGIWLMNGTSIIQAAGVGNVSPSVWSIAGVGDFNNAGAANVILWVDTSNDVGMWFMNGTSIASAVGIGRAPPGWSIVGVGDFYGEGYDDILWRDTAGDIGIWHMNGSTIVSAAGIANVPPAWSVAVTGDINGDGRSDIVWFNSGTGAVGVWYMNGTQILSATGIASVPGGWNIQGAAAD